MQETGTQQVKQCVCGCGEQVARRFRPGHDGRLKGRLLSMAKDSRWWVREAAVVTMVEKGWGHFLPMEIVASVPVRSRHHGRFVETRHADNLIGVVTDEHGISHSHWSCPEAKGQGHWGDAQNAGWLCGTCVHTHDLTQVVGHRRVIDTAKAG